MPIRHIGLTIAALLLLAAPAYAQTGMICGFVTNPAGKAANGVVMTLSLHPDAYTVTQIATTKTAAKGDYVFPNVTVGVYSVSFTLDGFKKVTRKDVQIPVGFVARVDQRLEPSAGEERTVAAEVPLSREAGPRVVGGTFTNVPTNVRADQPCGPAR